MHNTHEKLPTTLPKFFWHFIRKQWGWFLLAQIGGFAWALDQTLWPYVIRMLVDSITNYTGAREDLWSSLSPVLFAYGGLWFLIYIMFAGAGLISAFMFPRFEAQIRLAMFDYVKEHSYGFFASGLSGSTGNKINDMPRCGTHSLSIIMWIFVPSIIAIIIAFSLFAAIQPSFALILLLWFLTHTGIAFGTARRCQNLSNTHARSLNMVVGHMVDVFSNIISVKSFARSHYEHKHLKSYQSEELRKNQEASIYIEKTKIAISTLFMLGIGVGFTWHIIHCWQQGLINVAELVFIFMTSMNISNMAWHLGLDIPKFFKEIGNCQQSIELIRKKHDIKDREGAEPLVVKHGKIEIKNLTFGYEKERLLFDRFNLIIEPGEKVGIVGFSGAGKTTLVNLIMRFYEIEEGKILIDGNDIREVTQDSLHEQVSLIPQEPNLFHRTLIENIRYGNIEASDEEVIQASKMAYCHEFISELPEGYQTYVGERGIKLSGGQRQRIAIARALLKNSPILILDEATSALDSVTERCIQQSFKDLTNNKTSIVIAHRLSTLLEMDRIVVLHEGKLIEQGSHDDLLAANGRYAKMWSMQASGFLPEAEV
jgi:ATP-binding cassette subfamily B protein